MYGMARRTLNRERVLAGALEVADAEGIGSLTIRSLAQHLGVAPMAVYHYVANKDEILDGLVDLVFGEMTPPSPEGDWREEISRRSHSARRVLRGHPWAIALLDSRTSPGMATLRHHEATLATFRAGGFTIQQTAHAYALLDSYVYGFAVQEAALPFSGPDSAKEVAEPLMEALAGFPHMVEIATQVAMQPGYDFGNEFGVGLEMILDAMERWLKAKVIR